MIKYGTLTYNFESDRYSVRITEDNRERHIDLHCGDPLAVFMNEEWKDTRIEMCIFRLHPATCTVFFCHLAEQNPPPCRGCLPLHRWCKGSARSLRSGKALASKVQLVNQSS